MIRYKHLHILGGKGQKDLQQNQNISMRWNISFQWRLLQVAMLKKEARIKANAEICSVISVPASSAPICSWKLSLRRSPENQRQLDAQMQPLIAKWQRMTKRSGSYDNVVRSCSPDGSLACTSTPTSLPPCVSVHRPPKNLEREHNAATTVKFYAAARDRDAVSQSYQCRERGWRTAANLFLIQLQFFGDCSLDWSCIAWTVSRQQLWSWGHSSSNWNGDCLLLLTRLPRQPA